MAYLRPINVNVNDHNIGKSWTISKEYDVIISSHEKTLKITSTSTFTRKLLNSFGVEDNSNDILDELTFTKNVLHISLSHDEQYLVVIFEDNVIEVLQFEEIILRNQVYTFIYICMYTYMYTHIYTYIYIYIHIYTYIFIYIHT
jgi:hypothetical protein